ncbi:MAG: c-type cytochrome biogenesis protein CcsB [Thermodesulfobacteriota bacterium]
MESSQILSVVTFVYGLAAALYIFAWVFRAETAFRFAFGFLAAGAAGNALGIGLRWVESYRLGYGHAPFSNMYESLVFFALTISAICLVVVRRTKMPALGALASPLAFLALCYASLSPHVSDRIEPLLPALKSNWLIAHVMTCFLGYAAFAVGFCAGILYLLRERSRERRDGIWARIPDAGALDNLTHRVVVFGFLFLTIGIITGAVWANSAWGRYWGWDPKETWSLITWLFYATFLHARLVRGWKGSRVAWLSSAGFAAVIFTYFGVNYLPGLHSYGAMG